MKWDVQKKKYILKKIDRDGKVIAEKRNESGKKIDQKKKEEKRESIYKKWQQRTHLTLPKSGDMEDSKTIDHARRATEARRTLKEFKNRHGSDLYKGTDARSNSALVDKKTKKYMAKVRDENKKDRSENKKKGNGRSFGDKAMDKIQMKSRPTRSKMIVKR